MAKTISVLGIDPGLNKTGWGLVTLEGTRLKHIANGTIKTDPKADLPVRLVIIYDALEKILGAYAPDTAAVEETFVNKNAVSTLKLNHARTVAMLVPALKGLEVSSYAPNHVKKAVVGTGHADKQQIHMMVQTLLPGAKIEGADAADALAVAICHAHNYGTAARMKRTGTYA